MPPKPFYPPRPSTSSTPVTTKKGRPKGSTNKPKPTSTSKIANGVKKSTSAKARKDERERERLSAASLRYVLPSLSPDSDEQEDGEEVRDEEGSEDPFASPRPTMNRRDKRGEERREEEDNHVADLEDRKERIGEELLAVVLSRFFNKEGGGTRMSRDAVRAVGKYMDTFVREGVARAAFAEVERGKGEGVLEVEDLERLAPQLLLDF
ncbi:hypothetical protein L207DRAFT_551322 [Hyaloscypha variabilis F]|uniref:Centromere protein X n=1 Tax=Hyaloscypha variabilis (strain UAMH 11265 / GT02V1 / F) TaxID=1149755 RepID=A0A2J6S568_HYAVF|nr:hypothetical protein L207DRAFT_551322 [Hyaloscypha variabilis F]